MNKGTPTWTPNNISEVGNMAGKIAEQVIREVEADDRLAVFDKKLVENGDTIETVVTNLAVGTSYDSTGAGALTRSNPSLSVRYFKDWDRRKFKTTIDTSALRKVLEAPKNVSELSTKIVGELSEGDKQEKYDYTKQLLRDSKATADGGTSTLGGTLVNYETVAFSTGIQYKKVLTALKNAVSKMTFVNNSCNSAGIKRKTRKEDIVILMPYYLKNEIDVNDLAGAFNLSKAEVESKIIEIDDAPVSKYTYIYVVDRNAVLTYTRLFAMEDQKNADGFYWNYFLHTERLYAICPLFDAGYIKVGTEA